MTIVESIKCVLQQNNDGLTSKQIYDEIIRQGLYSFGAENPVGVVNAQLRRRCIGLDFPTAYPIKFFEIAGYEGKKIKFRLISTENTATIITAPKTTDISELLPEEKIKAALQEHLQNIRQQVFDSVLNNSPEFFEHLVVDLLLKMGYGYDKNSGIVTGKPHDGGIDGIISEDKLGLDLIYIQAKRFANGNKVTRHDLQAFIGAMEHINKGVFITTFTVYKDGETLSETEKSDFESYLLQTLPPNLFRFYFFDGEKISDFVFNSSKNSDFKDAFLKLCSLDTMEIIRENFRRISRSKAKGTMTLSAEYDRCLEADNLIAQRVECAEDEYREISNEILIIDQRLASLEKAYAKGGGISKKEWRSMQDQIAKED